MKKKAIELVSLYEYIFKYLNGQVNFNLFERWLVGHLDSLLSIASPDAQELINMIELGRAEISEGHRTEEEFQQELRRFISSHPTLSTRFGEFATLTASSNATESATPVIVGETAPRFSYRQL
jgi:hypothetical protein